MQLSHLKQLHSFKNKWGRLLFSESIKLGRGLVVAGRSYYIIQFAYSFGLLFTTSILFAFYKKDEIKLKFFAIRLVT